MLPPFVRKKTWIIVGKLQYVHSQGVARLFPFPKPLVCIIGKVNLASGFRVSGYFWVEMFHNYSPKRRSLPHLLPQLPTSRSPRWGFLVESPSCFSGKPWRNPVNHRRSRRFQQKKSNPSIYPSEFGQLRQRYLFHGQNKTSNGLPIRWLVTYSPWQSSTQEIQNSSI